MKERADRGEVIAELRREATYHDIWARGLRNLVDLVEGLEWNDPAVTALMHLLKRR